MLDRKGIYLVLYDFKYRIFQNAWTFMTFEV